MGNKFTPIDAESDSRILEVGRVPWTWLLPWCCYGCRRHGKIEVFLPPPDGTRADDPRWKTASTNDDIKGKIERSHHHKSPFCIATMIQREVGRVYRVKKSGQKIYLRAKGEREEDIKHKDQKWPPWRET